MIDVTEATESQKKFAEMVKRVADLIREGGGWDPTELHVGPSHPMAEFGSVAGLRVVKDYNAGDRKFFIL